MVAPSAPAVRCFLCSRDATAGFTLLRVGGRNRAVCKGGCSEGSPVDLVTCQGCGAVRDGTYLGKPHACWRNQDGSYEEGGTFQ